MMDDVDRARFNFLATKKDRTPREMEELRLYSLTLLLNYGRRVQHPPPHLQALDVALARDIETAKTYLADPTPRAEVLRRLRTRAFTYTCDECGAAPNCEYAFDSYNTDGDCIAEK